MATKKRSKKLIAKTKTDFIKKMKDAVAKDVTLSNNNARNLYDTFVQIMTDTIAAEGKLNLNCAAPKSHRLSYLIVTV